MRTIVSKCNCQKGIHTINISANREIEHIHLNTFNYRLPIYSNLSLFTVCSNILIVSQQWESINISKHASRAFLRFLHLLKLDWIVLHIARFAIFYMWAIWWHGYNVEMKWCVLVPRYSQIYSSEQQPFGNSTLYIENRMRQVYYSISWYSVVYRSIWLISSPEFLRKVQTKEITTITTTIDNDAFHSVKATINDNTHAHVTASI